VNQLLWLMAVPVMASVSVYPPRIELYGQDATQVFTVTERDAAGYERDITTSCGAGNVAAAKHAPMLRLKCGGAALNVPVVVKGAVKKVGVSFINDVSPIFTMSGCAGSNCHGSIRGQRGFKLSLFGNDPQLDFESVTNVKAKRIDRTDAAKSLLLMKATTETPHGGGFRFAPDSLQYRVLKEWIAQGAPFDAGQTPRIVSLNVYPEERLLVGKGAKQQLVAVAKYSDGSLRDVTHLAQYTANDPDTVRVNSKGELEAIETGETAVMVRTMGQAVAARILIAGAVTPKDYPLLSRNNFIDDHVFDKLKRLNVRPSREATEEEFLRRVYLDVTGLVPSAETASKYLASNNPAKRTELIEKLLGTREHAEVWALKFAELTRAGTREAGAKGAKIVYDYLRHSFQANKPYDKLVRELIFSQGSHSFAQSSMEGVPLAPTSFYNISFDSNAPDHATNISQLFLGVRMECAKCHNHPWERWTQDDFYGFAAFFARVGIKEVYENDENATQYMEEGSVEHPKTKKKVNPKVLDGVFINDTQDGDLREPLMDWMTAPKNPYFAKTIVNRVWKHYFGRGFVEEVDDFRVTNPPSHPALLDALAADFVSHGFNLRRLQSLILSHFPVRRLVAESLVDVMSQVSGVAEKFNGYPPETRAMQVSGGGGGYMLSSFGRLSRDIICERDSQPDMAQTMHLIAGATIQAKVSKAVLPWELSDDALLDHVYLSALVRKPSDAERKAIQLRISSGERKAVFQDVLWAIFNSKEFMYQH
jgi:hypothetical protein